MPEIFEIHDLHLVSRLSVVHIIDDLVARAKPDEIDVKFVANRVNETDQILVLLFGAVLVSLPVNEPGDLRIRPELGAQLLGAQTSGAHKVRPPMIVRVQPCIFPIDTSTARRPGLCIRLPAGGAARRPSATIDKQAYE